MRAAVAFANNDVVQIVWWFDERLEGCLGFAVYRCPSSGGPKVPLPTWVGFEGQNNPTWQSRSSEEWPIQKFEWRDLTAERGATYTYEVVPVSGEPGKNGPLKPMNVKPLTTNAVVLTPKRGSFATYFNRGILSTQFLAHAIPAGPSGEPNPIVLKDRIDQPGDPLRAALAGQILEGLESLLKRSISKGGAIYAALYELNDPELEQLLLSLPRLNLILSEAGTDDETNRGARQALHEKASEIGSDYKVLDRFVPSGHIGHNKFCVYVDSSGVAQAVLLGSTNWTDTGVCAQSNNALIVENPDVSSAYLAYWHRLEKDTVENGSKQSPEFRGSNFSPALQDLKIDNGTATLWFSPNTPRQRVPHPGNDEKTPPDLNYVFDLMSKAEKAILFLEFEPGSPSVVGFAADCLNKKPSLYVRGAVTDPTAQQQFQTTLIHRGDDSLVVAASAIKDQFSYWQKELLKTQGAHAIIHSKVVVIDPMSPNCIVVTGSHNQGYRASYNNDENMLIVKGHSELARAYAVHVMDVYDHYRFRSQLGKLGAKAFSGLAANDRWQDRYLDQNDSASKDHNVWL
jgi:phosphatidylserine/phosphatidylglycerophosphate/cardiolipin synthase-like enzyme